jgi:hypothetical protein
MLLDPREDRVDAGRVRRARRAARLAFRHDLALGQMPVAHQTLAAVIGELVGMAAEQGGNLGLDGLRQQRFRAVA